MWYVKEKFSKYSPLLCDHDPQQLVLQALGGDHEIQQGDFGGQFWQVVRVSEFSGNVKTEITGVFYHTLSQFDAINAT